MAGCSMVALWAGGSLCAEREGAGGQISQKMEEHELVVDYRFTKGLFTIQFIHTNIHVFALLPRRGGAHKTKFPLSECKTMVGL